MSASTDALARALMERFGGQEDDYVADGLRGMLAAEADAYALSKTLAAAGWTLTREQPSGEVTVTLKALAAALDEWGGDDPDGCDMDDHHGPGEAAALFRILAAPGSAEQEARAVAVASLAECEEALSTYHRAMVKAEAERDRRVALAEQERG